MSSPSPSTEVPKTQTQAPVKINSQQAVEDCLPCRIVGTLALGGVGLYALNQSRAHQPGSIVGKRIMAGLGLGTYLLSKSVIFPLLTSSR